MCKVSVIAPSTTGGYASDANVLVGCDGLAIAAVAAVGATVVIITVAAAAAAAAAAATAR
jgi:hypothetical protein